MVILYCLVLILFLFIYQYFNKGEFGVISFVMSLYVFSSIASFSLYYFFDNNYPRLELEPLLFFLTALFFIFFGMSKYKDGLLKYIVINNVKAVIFFEKILLFFSFLAILFFGYTSYSVVGLSISANDARVLIATGGYSSVSQYGLLNSFLSLVANLFFINIIFFFFNLSEDYPKRSILMARLHFIASFSYVFYIFSYMGRDGVIYWIITFFMLLLVFKDFIPAESLRKVKKFFLMSIAILLVPFLIITYSRFSGSGVFLSLLDYFGQQVFNFNDHYILNAPLEHGKVSFSPLLKFFNFFSDTSYIEFDRKEWFSYFIDRGVIPWVFSTFLGSFLHDFGRVGTLLAAVFIMFILRLSSKNITRNGFIKFSDLIIFFMFIKIISWGVFYYRHVSMFYTLVFILALVVFLKFSGRTKSIVLKKVR